MTFHDVYRVQLNDNLTKIGRAFGYTNPGPIHAYPPNQGLLRGRSPNLLRPGETLMVPYHPDLLRKIVATSRHLIDVAMQSAATLTQQAEVRKQDLEQFLMKIDAINFLANLGVGIGALAAQGIKGAEMSSKDALLWLLDSRASIGAGVTTMVVPAPQEPRRDFRFWVRHALGPWNPSYWASVVTAIRTGDVDVYLHGAGATTYREKLQIKQQADADIQRLQARIQAAEQQLAGAWYRARI